MTPHPYGELDYDAKKFSGGPVRYETLELVVPESPRRVYRRTIPEVVEIVWRAAFPFVIGALIFAFMAGVIIGVIATSRADLDTGARPISSLARGAAHLGVSPAEVQGSATGMRPAPVMATGDRNPLAGYATWYDVAPGNAAAGPAVRAWLGSGWRGTAVKVCHNGCVLTVLTDVCACGSRNGKPTLIDLSRSDFAVIAPPSSGVTTVTVSRAGAIALPATDTK